mmetsp:Transcript_8078/g.13948  ORF Transcript_8078/g.13948 Transcript_8078/m.13948 type:complete len:478 (-) Transcript_8078:58-1491(-)
MSSSNSKSKLAWADVARNVPKTKVTAPPSSNSSAPVAIKKKDAIPPAVGSYEMTSNLSSSPRYAEAKPVSILHNCIACELVAGNAEEIQAHLLKEHKIVISDSHKIAQFPKYLEFWKHRLQTLTIRDIASQIKAPTEGSNEMYYLISDVLDEDKRLREQLQTELLAEKLELQQRERANVTIARTCLFCRQAPRGRDALFEHMRSEHGFSVGQPDNLVDIDTLLGILRGKLDGLQCIYCERIFRDYSMLRVHMKKKRHFKINSQNKIYDQFYLINYLEWGKNWEDIANEKDFDDDDDETSSIDASLDTWHEWDEDAQASLLIDETTRCLFCDHLAPNPSQTLTHCKKEHNFDLIQIQSDWKLDIYGTVKLINYLRKSEQSHKCPQCEKQFENSESFQKHIKEEKHSNVSKDAAFFNGDQYLIPVLEHDPLLRYPKLIGGDDHWSDDEDELRKARDEAIEKQVNLFKHLEKNNIDADKP